MAITDIIFIAISIVAIIVSIVSINKIFKQKKLNQKSIFNYILINLLIFIILSIIFFMFKIYNYEDIGLKYIIANIIPLIILNINYLISINNKNQDENISFVELIKQNFMHSTIIIGLWIFALFNIILYQYNQFATNQKSLIILNFITIITITIILYQLVKNNIIEEIKEIDSGMYFLGICLYLYSTAFYLSNIVFTQSLINYSPIFFVFINIILIKVSHDNIKSEIVKKRKIDDNKSLILFNKDHEHIKKIINNDNVIIFSKSSPLDIAEKTVTNYKITSETSINSINPIDINKILYIINQKTTSDSDKNSTVIIDSIEYIAKINGINKTLDFLQNSIDYSKENRIQLICNMQLEDNIDDKELDLVMRDFDNMKSIIIE